MTQSAPAAAVNAFLYDASGSDRAIANDDVDIAGIGDEQLLWIDITGDPAAPLSAWQEQLDLAPGLLRRLADAERPCFLDNYANSFAFRIETPFASDDANASNDSTLKQSLAFIVSDRWIITFHASDIQFLAGFQAQDKGETKIGLLSPALLAVSLLDWHLAEFFHETGRIESVVDKIDERILKEGADRPVLDDIVKARRRVSVLRALLSGQRTVFYGLTRPDFAVNADQDEQAQFRALSDRYDRAIDEVERAREVVIGSFDVFTSMSSEETNDLVKGLTVVTAIIGLGAAIAGILGMNFEAPFFKTGLIGFIVATSAVVGLSLVAIIVAKLRKWI